MATLSDAQRYAVAALDSAAGQPRSAYQLRVKLRTLQSLVKMGMAQDVTPFGPGGMFSPETHYQFVWAQGRRDKKPSAAPPPDAARQEAEDKHPLYVLRQFDAMDPVGAEASHFIMAAPLRVIKAVLSLHNDAVQRVTRETAGGGRCTLHRSSASPIWGGAWHFTIQKKGS